MKYQTTIIIVPVDGYQEQSLHQPQAARISSSPEMLKDTHSDFCYYML